MAIDGDNKGGGEVVLPALVPNEGQADFWAAGGTFPALGACVEFETKYGTPIEAPSKVANIRGRPAMRPFSTLNYSPFRPADRVGFANRDAVATSATSCPFPINSR